MSAHLPTLLIYAPAPPAWLGRLRGVMTSAMTLPPKAGRVQITLPLSGSISRPVQSAVRPL